MTIRHGSGTFSRASPARSGFWCASSSVAVDDGPSRDGAALVVPGAVLAGLATWSDWSWRRGLATFVVLGGASLPLVRATRSSRRGRRTGCAARRAPWPSSSRPGGCGSAPAGESVMIGCGHVVVDRVLDRPATLAGVRDPALDVGEVLPFCSNARPASSSSHERMTVPCIHALAMASRSSGYSDACMISKPSA